MQDAVLGTGCPVMDAIEVPSTCHVADIAGMPLTQDEMWQRMLSVSKATLVNQHGLQRRPSSEGVTLQAYIETHWDAFDELRSWERGEGWNYVGQDAGIDIYTARLPEHSLGLGFKGVAHFPLDGRSIGDLAFEVLDIESRPKWDAMCTEGRILEQHLPFYRYSTYRVRSPFSLVAPRELLLLGRVAFDEDGAILVRVESVDLLEYPVQQSHVRARFRGGYIFRPTRDPNLVKIVFAGSADPSGHIPRWVKDLVAPKQCKSLAKFKQWCVARVQDM